MSLDELNIPINTKDKAFADLAVQVFRACQQWDNIEPFRANMMEAGSRFIGIGISMDGGRLAYGSLAHILSQNMDSLKQDTNLIGSSSKVSKRTVPHMKHCQNPMEWIWGRRL